ncbi:MAG: hypothetical protein U9R75_06155 [Candidatus Thermoplasmatota archaeon]|nr:hypothetical protein [Candidatus Thermoplasmatota archaeon]
MKGKRELCQSIDYVFEVDLFTYEEEACEGDVCPVQLYGDR